MADRHEHDWEKTKDITDPKSPEVKIEEFECKTEKDKKGK